VAAKLRRGESFEFTWRAPEEEGGGTRIVWLHPAMQLRFVYEGSRTASLNRDWIEALMASANTGELRVLSEPGGPTR
jgi:hypothetical protein